jgi:hypothetical protein
MPDEAKKDEGWLSSGRLAGVGIVACSVILVGILYLLASFLSGTGIVNEFGLPILTVAGAVLVLGAMALISLSFALFDLSDKAQALALPEGSIRAVIALMLIVLFAILAIYLYGSMAAPRVGTAQNLTASGRETFIKNLPQGSFIGEAQTDDRYTVYFRNDRNAASDDLAKQLIVLVGTLVTSLVSFYFGSRATSATAEAVTAAVTASGGFTGTGGGPSLRNIAPDTLQKQGGPVAIEIRGQSLELAQAVKLVAGTTEIACYDVVSNADVVRCKVAIEDVPALASWDVVVTDSRGRTATLPQAVSITEAEEGGSEG